MPLDQTPTCYGKPLGFRPTPAELVRILRRVEVDSDTGCWLWTGAKDPKGYGRVKLRGGNRWVHRVLAQWRFGDFDPGIEANHKPECRNPSCCNPDHLEPMTKTDNTADGNRRRSMPQESEADELFLAS